MSPFLKELFFKLAPKPMLAKRSASILMYHSVNDRQDFFSAVSPEVFNKQMAYLAAKKREVISLVEFVRRLRTHEPLGGSIALTFDDGYRDNYTTVFPLLKQYNFPATIFVTTGLIGNPGYCSLEELRDMHGSGLVAIEPHTLSHPKLAKLSRADANSEIRESRRMLEEMLGTTPMLFAYPYGSFSEETTELVRELGFMGAVTVEEGTVGPSTDVFRLSRNSIDSSTTFSQFRGKVSRTIDWYISCKRLIHI